RPPRPPGSWRPNCRRRRARSRSPSARRWAGGWPAPWGATLDAKRYLVVTADDYGIGPATSQGILDLAAQGRVTCSVLIVNTDYAELAVRAWRQAGRPLELGWHPCLTLDR